MKIIYKLVIKYHWDRYKCSKHIFDNYDAVEEGLDKNLKGYRGFKIKIEALALCDICKEYKAAKVSELMKKHGSIYMLCEDCVGDYKIKLDKYIKEEE